MAVTRALFAGDDTTPDSVKRRRAMAEALLQQGAQIQNVDSPLEAIGSLLQSWGGYQGTMRADADEKAGKGRRAAALGRMTDSLLDAPGGFGATPATTSAAAMPGATSNAASAAPIVPAGDIETSFLNTVKGGVTNPFGLAAVAATGRAESSYSPENAFGAWSDPSQSGQPGTAGGILSWRAERLDALKAFAQANGDDPSRPSPATQAKFFLQEDPALVERLNAAGSVEEAQSLMNNAWKFAGYDRPGGEAERRLSLARGYLPGFQGGGQGAQVASLDPSAGMAATAPAASNAFDWSPYATAGATREDSFSGMTPEFRGGLQALVQAAPPELGLQVGSGYRSVQRQQELWDASDKTGRTVARPGRSQHNHGNAADLYAGGVRLDKASPEARAWVHANAGQFGLSFPMDYEPWHVELAGARGGGGGRAAGGAAAPVQVASTDPTAGMALAYARPGIELGTGTVDVPNPLQTPGPRPVQAVAPTPVASQQYDLPPVPTPAPRDGRQALAAELLGGAAGPGDPWQGLREADVAPAPQAAQGGARGQAMASQLLADAAPQAPASSGNRALIAQLLADPWTEDLGQTLLSQEIENRQWLARQRFEAQQQRGTLLEQRAYDTTLRQDERAYDDRVRQEGFGREDQRNAVEDRRADRDYELRRREANEPPVSIQEYEYARQQGYTGTFAEYETAQKKAGATTISTGSPGDGKLIEKLSENEGKRWSDLQAAGATAAGLGQDLDVLGELIKIAPQGPLVGRFAEMFPEGTDAGAAFQSVISRAAPGLRVEGSGATSDVEYQGMLASLPRLRNTPEANAAIVQTMRAKAEINIRRAEIVNRFQNEEIDAKTARRLLNDLNKVSIMSPSLKAVLGATGSDEPAKADVPADLAPGTVVDGYVYKGGDPALEGSWELAR